MRPPRKAMILAAGFGTRLLPLTRALPKSLLPIDRTPNLERLLAMLRGWGAREVLVNLHHRADRLFEHLRARPADGLRIACSFEAEILGTGGALRKAEWFFAGEEPIWVVNGDIVVARLSARPFLRAYDPRRTIAAAWVHGALGPRTVEAADGAITDFDSPRRGAPGAFTFCGVQLVNPRLLDRARGYVADPAVFESVIDAYRRAQQDGWRVAAVEAPRAFWADIGTPEQYLACHRALAGGRDFAAIDAAARVHPRARIRNSVVMAGAVVGPRARLENAIVAPGARIDRPAGGLMLPATDAFDAAELAAVTQLGWRPAEVAALPLGARGSNRAYTRLAGPARATAMLVRYDAARVENRYHVGHTRFLRRLGVPAPRVQVDRPRDGIAIFEDLGDLSLLAWQQGRPREAVRAMYRRILEATLRLHEAGARAALRERLPLMPAFGPALYLWEREYFAEEMLRRREGRSPEYAAPILRELSVIARRLARAPRVLLHRDLQSSNILIRAGRPWFIDYQGMRFGPAVYDLASLLCDPYVELDDALIRELVDHYARRCAAPTAVRALFWHGAVQRLVQALGAFAKLGAQPATRAFAQHIPAARRMLARALAELPGCDALRAWCA